jgi:putative hydrolase of the HAD superfamily
LGENYFFKVSQLNIFNSQKRKIAEKMRKYSVIVSDLGNVLIPFNYNIAIKKLEKIEPGLGHRFFDYIKSHYDVHRKFERGDISPEEFLNTILPILENKVAKEEFLQIYSQIFTINEGLVSLFSELKKKHILVLMSNTNWIHHEYAWGKYEFINLFDKLVLSYEVRSVKPEPGMYKAVEAFTGRSPAEHIFIDDIAEYAEAAKALGWDAIQFINNEQLVKELSSRGIL